MAPNAERRFEVMGTNAHIVVVGPDPEGANALAALAEQLTRRLERRWSRFDPQSEVSALNRSNGEPVDVSPETFELVAKSVLANALTEGRFDPTLLPAIKALGYDRTFDEVTDSHGPEALARRPRSSIRTNRSSMVSSPTNRGRPRPDRRAPVSTARLISRSANS